MEQYHLKGKFHSGRAIRVKSLDETEVSKNLETAALLVGEKADMLTLKKAEFRSGARSFIRQISEPCEDPMKATFKKVTHADLADLSEYFTAKDMKVLEALWFQYHDLTKSELDDITGKALPVSED